MPYQTWILDAAKATGYPVVEVAGWQTRGSATFDPKGLIWHHTAGPATGDMPTLQLLINGRSDLPGPLSQFGLGRSGTIYVIAAGKANHGGAGNWQGVTGNSSVFGIEAEHTGKSGTPWPAAQLDAYVKLSAELAKRGGFDESMVCGHKEWATPAGRKIDPIDLDMNDMRRRIALAMEADMAHPETDHANFHSKGPNTWGDAAWAEFVAKKYTTLNESRTWEVRREDLAFFRQQIIKEVQAMIDASGGTAPHTHTATVQTVVAVS